MTLEEEKAIKDFKSRIRHLLLEFKQLKEDSMHLHEEVKQLKDSLEIATAAQKKSEDNYEALKTARIINISNEDLAQSKRRIDKLEHKVDKCIAMLNI